MPIKQFDYCKPTPGLMLSLSITKARYDNPWMKEFLGDWKVQEEVSHYGTEQKVRIVSEDGSKIFEGTTEIGFGYGTQNYNYYESTLQSAIDNAFSAFTKTLPRMDRIMRYGK